MVGSGNSSLDSHKGAHGVEGSAPGTENSPVEIQGVEGSASGTNKDSPTGARGIEASAPFIYVHYCEYYSRGLSAIFVYVLLLRSAFQLAHSIIV